MQGFAAIFDSQSENFLSQKGILFYNFQLDLLEKVKQDTDAKITKIQILRCINI